ncbi:MAG: cell division protein SepF [Lachnospiraceae bacterium]|nr:cell division protein SepF [Lachnospiraceae bacterium]
MGNFLERILNGMNITDEDDFDDFDDIDTIKKPVREKTKKRTTSAVPEAATEEPAPLRKDVAKAASIPTKTVRTQRMMDEDNFDNDYTETKRERAVRPERMSTSNRVVPLRSASATRGLEVSIMKPTRFDDSQDICDMLLDERATVVNLEGIDLALAQRIMDFIAGAVYALNGKIHQISGLIFIVSPENVDISGDYLSYVEQNGFEVPTLNQ